MVTPTNQTACANFPTGIEVADDTTALVIYATPRTAAKKMPHEDRASEDDSRTKCRTFSFFVPGNLDV